MQTAKFTARPSSSISDAGGGQFYVGAVASAESMSLGGLETRVATPGSALATKAAAWQGRAKGEQFGSKDFEHNRAPAIERCLAVLRTIASASPHR